MTISLTTWPRRADGAIGLTISGTGTVTSIVRADRNGTRDVRGIPYLLPRPAPFALFDAEPALAGPVVYRVTTAEGTKEVWATFDLPGEVMPPIFSLPSVPSWTMSVEAVLEYSSRRESSSTVHDIDGRSDPVVIFGRLGTRRGKLSALCPDFDAARELVALLDRGQVVLYRQAEYNGLDLYFTVQSVETARSEDFHGQWLVNVEYIEVTPPRGAVLAPTWSFADLKAAGGTFARVATEYEDFVQLRVKDKKR